MSFVDPLLDGFGLSSQRGGWYLRTKTGGQGKGPKATQKVDGGRGESPTTEKNRTMGKKKKRGKTGPKGPGGETKVVILNA